MTLYSFFLEPNKPTESPQFLKAITEPDTVRPAIQHEFTLPPSRIVYRIVRSVPPDNPPGVPVQYFAVIANSRADRPIFTHMGPKGL